MNIKTSGKSITGSKGAGIGYLYIAIIMFLAIALATLFTGGFIPVDPNGPEGPPTLPPYFNLNSSQEEQAIILPSEALTPNPKNNLQLQTFQINACRQTSAINILIDTSGSMTDENKIGKLKEALKTLTQSLSGTSAITIQTFSAVVEERVPWGLYKNNKTQVQATINNLDAQGWTRMRDGFKLAERKLYEAMSKNKFPGYNYSLLLISDGVPEIPPPKGTDTRDCYIRVDDPITAPAKRCFAKNQDPRGTPNDSTNLPQSIKNMGVSIYAIGLYASQNSSDVQLRNYLEPLLQEVVSKPAPAYYYAYDSANNAENLKRIFNNIVTKICEDQLK